MPLWVDAAAAAAGVDYAGQGNKIKQQIRSPQRGVPNVTCQI